MHHGFGEDSALTSLVLKRVPPRCTSAVLLEMLDSTGCEYDFVHLPYDIRHHKTLSLAFVNFLDQETASHALDLLSSWSNFPQGLAPSTQVSWGHIHGLGPNLAHFIARFGLVALDPPYAPYIFLNGRHVPRTRDIVQQFVTMPMLLSAQMIVKQRDGPGETADNMPDDFWQRPLQLSDLTSIHFEDLERHTLHITPDSAMFRF
mmetsp:Transcript_61662/g.144608  ORF Transcript_61662/g.144608 Transcript_61662/m.144608 type:complete len:204 (-) Transcript_61662:154-765(-)